MKFGSILRKYLIQGRTGQIVIKFAGEEHLCKIYIEDGNAVYISMGNRKPDDTISYIAGKKIEEANFIEGVPPLKRLSEPLNEKLLMQEGYEEVHQSSEDIGEIKVEGIIPPQKVNVLLDNFIDIVGPLGTMFAERIFSNLGYDRGAEMSGEDYSLLLSALLEEIPGNRRDEFKNKNLL